MFTLSLCVLLFFTCVQGKKTTCITTVPSTRSPTLTCFFSEDVSHTKKDFTVHRHYGNSATAVVDCAWEIHSDTPECITEEGYTFNRIVTDQMTVEITRVAKGESRKYTCELSGSKPEDRSFCDLSTDVTTCEIQSVQLMSNTTLTCHFPEDITNSKKDYNIYHIKNNIPEAVLKCRWLSDDLKCYIAAHDKYIVTNFTKVHILQVTENDTGNYKCEISGTTQEQSQSCQFTLLPVQLFSHCEAQSVTLLSESNLTCHFPEDIGQSKKDFTVYHYTDQGHPAVAVVDCRWLSYDIKCITQPGYEYDRTVSITTTVRIPRVTREETGKYTCSIRGSTLEDSHFCDLTLSTEGGSASVSLTGGQLAGIVIPVLLAVTGIGIAIAVVCCRHRGRHLCRSKPKLRAPVPSSEQSKVEMPLDQGQDADCPNRESNLEDQNESHDLAKKRGVTSSKLLRNIMRRKSSRQESQSQHEHVPFMESTPAPDALGNLGISELSEQVHSETAEIPSQPDEATS